MSVEFEEQSYDVARPRIQKKSVLLSMQTFIYKLGLAKTEAEAQKVLLYLALAGIVVALFIVVPAVTPSTKVYVHPANPKDDPSLLPIERHHS